MDDLEAAAWDELRAATPADWFVGRPGQGYDGSWTYYAFDTTERAQMATGARVDGSGQQ
jgi:hypothetical protein